MPEPSERVAEEARALAEQRCRAAGIAVRPLDSAAEVGRAVQVLRGIWGTPDALAAPAMRALEHAGSYVMGVYSTADGELIGASAAFFAEPDARRLHSHVTGVRAGRRGAGVGTALKLDQRAWALERGLRSISWTFDPLVARNAHLNLARLGARVTDYLADFYGSMGDEINRGDATDRLHVEWEVSRPWPPPPPPVEALAAPVALTLTTAGRPAPAPVPDDAPWVRIVVPADVESLRASDADLAGWWRTAVRDALQARLETGHEILGFTAASGHYLLGGPR
ncbi:hypothetical protein [Actinotalea sp. C106]|uniref:hypothetical protein n=1 Tax=Actinotalea sp. C106 TaxID=2908644 RepID=UPI00202975FC|nr:hypothetical protein [Actinotalea sp. C106]